MWSLKENYSLLIGKSTLDIWLVESIATVGLLLLVIWNNHLGLNSLPGEL